MVFYRTYRPKTLSELDNRRVAELIEKYLVRESLPHAFLFTGSKGTGKTSTARIVAKSVNCQKGERGDACGVCETCVSIAEGRSLDILEIDAASNRGIDEIRDLREKIKLAPSQLQYKVYIIDEVHMLTTEAFNALLKTLEEPPKHAIFILATTELHKIPDTIISRCVRVDFHKATEAEIVHALERVVKGESLSVEEGALGLIAQAADGSFRDGVKILEEVAVSGSAITKDAVQSVIGTTDSVVLNDFLAKLKQKNAAELLLLVQSLTDSGKNMSRFFQQVLLRLERELVSLVHGTKSDWAQEELVRILQLFSHAYGEQKSAIIPTLPFELAIVEYCEVAGSPQKRASAVASIVQAPSVASDVSVDTSSAASIAAKWPEILEGIKASNHSIVGVLRSCRPLSLADNTLTIEAAYKFHAERLADPKVCELIAKVLKDVVGLDLKITTVLKQKG